MGLSECFEIKLMKLYSEPRSAYFDLQSGRDRQNCQFEVFKDEQFMRHKQEQSRHKSKSQNSSIHPHMYNVTRLKPEPTIAKSNLNLSCEHQPRKAYQNVREASPQAVLQLHAETLKDEKIESKPLKNPKLQRYARASNSETKILEDPLNEQCKQRSQKISILTKIIEHYNSKAIHQSIESNLITKITENVTSTTSCKNKLIAIRRMAPKVSVRKDLCRHLNKIEVAQLKVKNRTPGRGIDFFDSYFDHSQILIEAQGLNELIKNKQEGRKKANKSVNEQQLVLERKSNAKISYHPISAQKRIRYDTLPAEKPKSMESNIETSINIKVNKFREFLFLINFCNRVYRELDITKYETPFRIYIGKGNNSNLVKAIMKRRFWFEIAKNAEEAHFVWTQIKEQNVYERQRLLSSSKTEKGPLSKESKQIEANSDQCKFEQLEQTEVTRHTVTEQASLDEQSIKPKERNSRKPRKQREKSMCTQLEYKIMTKQQLSSLRLLNHELSQKKKTLFSDRIMHLKNFSQVKVEELRCELIHNHLPLNGLLGNKKAMFYMLRQYYRLTSKDIFSVVPLTFHIKKGVVDDQYKQFMNKFVQNRLKGLPNYWIVKPGEFSNRGQGISCTNKLEEIKGRITKLKGLKNRSLIVQQYITNPLLYNGRKFDIRTYMLVTVNNQKLRAYWYQDGYVRTASYQWSLQDIADNQIHLTNDAIQKYASNYGRYEPGNKLTYSQLQRYFDSLPRPTSTKSCSIQNDIYPKLKQIATDAIKSTFCFIDPNRQGNNFEIFGFDFMIDNNFKPWLIEINTNPCLEMSCPVLNRIVPSMLENAFRIGLDPIIPPPLNFSSTYKYSIPENALHYNKFQLIFDEDRDGAAIWQMYKDSSVVKQIDEYEEDKDTYEQQGQQICLEDQ